MASKLYLAYGSNLNKTQMRRRCHTARPLGSLMLQDAQLVFRGVADVIYQPGSQVPVGVWRIYRHDEEALDRYEGVKTGFYAKEMVELDNGQEALLYVMRSSGIFPPSQYYYDTICKGYKDFGLETAYLENALQQSYMEKEPDEWTANRRKRQLNTREHARLARP